MLDRSQHLKLFLTGSGVFSAVTETVISDKRVQKELDRHPVNAGRLFKTIRRLSRFKFSSSQEDDFLFLFGSYR